MSECASCAVPVRGLADELTFLPSQIRILPLQRHRRSSKHCPLDHRLRRVGQEVPPLRRSLDERSACPPQIRGQDLRLCDPRCWRRTRQVFRPARAIGRRARRRGDQGRQEDARRHQGGVGERQRWRGEDHEESRGGGGETFEGCWAGGRQSVGDAAREVPRGRQGAR